MIDIEFLREHPEEVAKGIRAKGVTDVDVSSVLRVDGEWRTLLQAVEALRHEQHVAGGDVSGQTGVTREKEIAKLRVFSDQLRQQEEKLKHLTHERERLLLRIPNLPLPNVPVGASADENITEAATPKPSFSFPPKSYLELADGLGIIDLERSARSSGSRFGSLVGDGALLEFSLVRFAVDTLVAKGFTPIVPPVLVKRDGLAAMGYLERGEEEVYKTQDDLYLVGTSEQSLGAMHRNEKFSSTVLPRRFAAFSTCFRREAGSYGRDTRGILRVHQFDKVEMFAFCLPETSVEEHAYFLTLERELMDTLSIPYCVVRICTGDLGDPAAAKVDLEAWLPGSQEYRETHSTSNTTDFQTRRLNVTFRREDGTSGFVHAINGTAIAIGRTVAAILENYQRADGSVGVPQALQPYMGNRETIAPVV